MFTESVCVLLTVVSLKLIKIKLIYATTSSWEKKQIKRNGAWKVSDADWFYFSFYNPSWSESNFILFLFFYSIRVGPSRSELIRPGLAVRVDPVWLLHLPSCSFVQCRKYHTMKCCRRASHLGRFTLWNNGRRATQLGRFTLWHYGRLATQLSRFTLWHNRRWASRVAGKFTLWHNGRWAKQPGLMHAPGVARICQRKIWRLYPKSN